MFPTVHFLVDGYKYYALVFVSRETKRWGFTGEKSILVRVHDDIVYNKVVFVTQHRDV